MTRCAKCGDVTTRVPHTRGDATECSGRMLVVHGAGALYARVVQPTESMSLTITGIRSDEEMAAERLAETHFDMAPAPPGVAYSPPAESFDAVLTVTPPDPVVVVLVPDPPETP